MIKKIFSNIIYLYKKILYLLHFLSPKSFFSRIFLILFATILALQIIFVIILYDNQWRQIRNLINNNITYDIKYIFSKAQESIDIESFVNNFNKSIKPTELNPQIIKNPTYIEIDTNSLNKASLTLYNKLSLALNQKIYSYKNNNNINNIIIKLNDNIGLAFNLQEDLFYLSSFTNLVLLLIASFTLIILILFQFFRLQIRPLKNLSNEAKKLGIGEKTTFIVPSGAKEIRNVITAFNLMREQIERFVEHRTLMLGAISHDLNTILTRINLIIELDNKNAMELITKESLLMQDIIKTYLNFAKDDQAYLVKNKINIKTFFTNHIKTIYFNKDIIITNNQLTNPFIKVNNILIQRVIDNIIENSLKYGANKIIIDLKNKGNSNILITFLDNGVGIEEKEWDNVFKPFYTIDKSRNIKYNSIDSNDKSIKGYSSSGLGLYIVKDIITKHGGSIYLEKSSMGGISVCIILPI